MCLEIVACCLVQMKLPEMQYAVFRSMPSSYGTGLYFGEGQAQMSALCTYSHPLSAARNFHL